TDNSALFNFISLRNEAGDGLDFEIVKGTTATQVANNANNRGAGGLAGLIDLFQDNGTPAGMQAIMDHLGTLDDAELSQTMSRMLPVVTGGLNRAASGSVHGSSSVVTNRIGNLFGRSSGDGFITDQYLWFKAFGSWTDQNQRKGVEGYKSDALGLVLGSDGELSAATRVGLAFSYINTEVKNQTQQHRADVDSYQLTGYSSHRLSDVSDLSVQASLGLHTNEGKRVTFLGTAASDYDAWSANIGAAYTRNLALSERTSFSPSVRADYTYIHSDSYQETGAGALNLNVDSATAEALMV